MDTLVVLDRESTIEQDTTLAILGVDIVVLGAVGSDGGNTRTVLVDGPVLAAVGIGHETLEESVAGVPVGGEVAVSVGEVTGVNVLGKTRLLVCTDCVALLAVDVLGSEVVCVNGTHDVETVTVISGDEDESLLEAVGLVELPDGGLDGVVELEELTEGTVVVENVHHLVDGSSLGHEEPTSVTRASLKDVNGLEGHLLETGLVESGLLVTSGRKSLVQVLAVDVAVKPLGHVGGGEDTESLLRALGSKHFGAVLDNGVASLAELVVVVLVLVCNTAERRVVELLSTTTEDDIDGSLGPGVVLDTVKEGINNSAVLGTGTGVSN